MRINEGGGSSPRVRRHLRGDSRPRKKMTMPFDPASRLRDHVRGLIGRPSSRPEMIEVMRLTRFLLEKEKAAQTYPHISLYCDWLFHTEINRHALALSILERTARAIAKYDEAGDVAAVSQALNLAQLRHEMTILFSAHKIPTDLLDSFANWKAFSGALLEDLCDRPIKLPNLRNRKAKKLVEQTVARMKAEAAKFGHNIWPRALFISADTEKGVLNWTLEYEAPDLIGPKTFRIQSALQMTEKPTDFRRS